MEVVFQVRALGDLEAHVSEDHGQLFHHLIDRVQLANAGRSHRAGDVHGFAGERCVQGLVFQRGLARFNRLIQPIAQTIQRRAHDLTLFRGHLA